MSETEQERAPAVAFAEGVVELRKRRAMPVHGWSEGIREGRAVDADADADDDETPLSGRPVATPPSP
ncbi:hypothetical protein AMK16_04255 [Streptomyces sp. CB00455]|uniref:hypothetical protein n=1 Tax=Streptomyces sp. CB00455 TaxID=1703927 RepID=UPI00095E56DD|nr:hypothetical protein [Streptomyces sp. CB00455]OKK22364.1 hypothetical protein AMK16_04255 [Streptomyces sp. CB00455]